MRHHLIARSEEGVNNLPKDVCGTPETCSQCRFTPWLLTLVDLHNLVLHREYQTQAKLPLESALPRTGQQHTAKARMDQARNIQNLHGNRMDKNVLSWLDPLVLDLVKIESRVELAQG
jgi:hypothetical protein